MPGTDQQALHVMALADTQREESIRLLQGLIRIPSVWGHAAPLSEAAEYLGAAMSGLGGHVSFPDSGTPGMPNLLATLGPAPGTGLLFNGHMEVYPPSLAWSRDPFGAELSDGRIYGVGVADMKAGTAAMVAALRIILLSGLELRRNVAVLAVPNHFEGGEGTRQALRQGTRADMVINGEPSGLRVLLGQRGIVYLKVRIKGVAAHTTATDIGVNAIERASRVIQQLQRLPMMDAQGGHIDDSAICNVAMISGGLARNLIPDACDLTIDVRFPPSQTQDSVLADINGAVERALGDRAFAEVQVEETCLRNPRSSLEVPHTHPLVQNMVACHALATNSEAEFGFHRAWPDTPIFWEAGIPAITYGPGSMDCYWDDEYVDIDEYLSAIKAYCAAIVHECV